MNKLLEAAEEEGKAPVATLKVSPVLSKLPSLCCLLFHLHNTQLESFAGMWALERPFAELRGAIRGADAYFLVLSTDYASKEFTRPKSWMTRVSSVYLRRQGATSDPASA